MLLTICVDRTYSFTIEISDSATVLDVKTAIEQSQPDLSGSTIRLIASGKILSDQRTISSYGISAGQTVQAIQKRQRPAPAPPPSPAPPSPAPPPPAPAPAPAPVDANLQAQTEAIANRLRNSPEFPDRPDLQALVADLPGLARLLSSWQTFLSSPAFREALQQMTNNPQFHTIARQTDPSFTPDPDVNVFDNLTMEPDLFAEFILRSPQGGFPSVDSALAFAGTSGGANLIQALMANPDWLRLLPATRVIADHPEGIAEALRTYQSAVAAGQSPQEALIAQSVKQMEDDPGLLRELVRGNPLFANLPGADELLATPEVQRQCIALMQQIAPGMNIGELWRNPLMAQSMEAVMQKPQLLQRLAQASPVLRPIADQPDAIAACFRQLLDFLRQTAPPPQRFDPALWAALGGGDANAENPDARRGLAMVVQGLQICRANGFALLGNIAGVDALLANTAGLIGTAPAPAPAPQIQLDGGPPAKSEDRFAREIAVLEEMGFSDRTKNLTALDVTRGNVENAIEWLLAH